MAIFTPFKKDSSNPVIPLGSSTTWDDTFVFSAVPYRVGNDIYLYYTGATNTTDPNVESSIGLAISTDNGVSYSKQGVLIPRGTVGLGGSGKGLAVFDIKEYNGTYYMFVTAFYSLTDFRIAVLTSTDLFTWGSLTDIITSSARQHGPHVIDHPSDSSKWLMHYAYIDGSGAYVIGNAMADKSSPTTWTENVTNPVFAVSGLNVLYPEVSWNGVIYEMLFSKGPINSKFEVFKSIANMDSTLKALEVSGSGWDAGYVTVSRTFEDRVFFTGRQTNAPVIYDGVGQAFKQNAFQNWNRGVGAVSYVDLGNIQLVGGATNPSVVRRVSPDTGEYSVWIYDDLSTTTNFQNTIRIIDATGNSLAGVWNGTSTTHYVYRTKGGSFTASSVARTTGWHRISFVVGSNVLIKIDGKVVATDNSFTPAGLSEVVATGYTAGTGIVSGYVLKE